ncbi:MAG TPA: nitroreductase family protein [Caldisericia bacterium]|nr:nitroreductase family protein [Caldisericia bacterium]
MNLAETIKKRKSVRTYVPTELSGQIITKLSEISSGLKGPFEVPFRFVFFKAQDKLAGANEGLKLGTYGVIRGAKHYIAGIVTRSKHDLEQLGYAMEHLILYATDMNLGTCWLGGTFSKKNLLLQLNLNNDEHMPAITPLGYSAKDESFLSKSMKWGAKSATRKAWSELFFKDMSLNPLNPTEAGAYEQALELLRLAPSASNKQPWRIVKDGSSYHFFMQENKMTTKAVGFPLQRVDMGIAMCHFELGARELGLKGSWVDMKLDSFIIQKAPCSYLITWQS